MAPDIGLPLLKLRKAFPTGVATARQLIEMGCLERTVYKRCLDGGPWQRILPGIVLLFTGQPTREQEVHAASLLCGPDAVVTGIEACWMHGVRRGPVRDRKREVHVLVPSTRQVRSVGYVHVERTERLPQGLQRGAVRIAPMARACTDAVRRLRSPGEVTELLSDAVQRGLCTVGMLGEELEAGSRRGTAVPRRVLSELAIGIRSAAEREARVLWRASGLPEPLWNVPVYRADGRLLGVADCWLDDVAMVWEIESSEWHLAPSDHDRTVERAAAFTAAGAVYTATKPKRLRTDGRAVIETLRATYRQAAQRPRPPLRIERAA
ncbi:hypothetical protein WEH80_29040 [Actinomycetes bacterium KLBMP 9759]